MKNLLTLAIDTSFDETSVAVVLGQKVLSNILPSQTELHAKFGGTVPSIARLAHQERIDSVVLSALKKAKVKEEDLDLVAVTLGPGLAIALEVGIKKAKELASKFKKPLITINHMEGHLLSVFAERNSRESFSDSSADKPGLPSLGILVSGKHTELVLVNELGNYKIIGETLDDACGEAFDKCGRVLGFGFPAGPVIAEFAKKHRGNVEIEHINSSKSEILRIKSQPDLFLPIPMTKSKDLNFSYSGIKTAFKKLCAELSGENLTSKQEMEGGHYPLSKKQILDLCVLFEETAFKQIEVKVRSAIKKYKFKELWLGGGVSANTRLRQILRKVALENNLKFRFPSSKKLTTDNAAMIAVAANLKTAKLLENSSLADTDHQILAKNGIYLTDFHTIDREPSLRL